MAGVGNVKVFKDSESYYRLSRLPLTDAEFWTAERPPVVLLFFKVFGTFGAWQEAYNDPTADGELVADDHSLLLAQTLLSASAWTALAVACAACVRTHRRGARLLIFAIPLAIGLAPQVSQWNFLALSESLTLSTIAALAALWLTYARTRIAWLLIAIAVVSTLFAAARDVNPYFLLMAAPMIAWASFAMRHRPAEAIPLLLLAVWFTALFFAVDHSADRGQRWLIPYYNNIGKRVLPVSKNLDFFRSQGMPVSYVLSSYTGKYHFEDGGRILYDPELAQFRAWSMARGKTTYTAMLLRNPVYTLTAPVYIHHSLLFSIQRYRHSAQPDLSVPLIGSEVLKDGYDGARVVMNWLHDATVGRNSDGLTFAESVRRVPLIGGVVAVTIILAFLGRVAILVYSWRLRLFSWRPAMAAPVAMMGLAVPGIWLAWHGDANETSRHIFPAAFLGHLGFILLGLLVYADLCDRGSAPLASLVCAVTRRLRRKRAEAGAAAR